MTDAESSKPPRRPRYAGKNPRQFQEKYKEHAPQEYPDDVAKVLASGKTPAGTHRPIMVKEILQVLAPQPGQIAVDCTLGYGGHTQALLTAVAPTGKVIGIDADPVELPKTQARLQSLGFGEESFVAVRANFAGLAQLLPRHAPEGADMILADLGVSSMQLDNPERGFTWKGDAPLDMRLNPQKGPTAAELLSRIDADELAGLLTDNSDEPLAKVLAHAITSRQRSRPLQTTKDLAELIRESAGRYSNDAGDIETTVRRVFQAVRIAVNNELDVLDAFLKQLPWCLKPGGRVAILTFHSGEDRRVKHHFKAGQRDGLYSSIAENVTRASGEERRENTRSIPAKLRWAVRSEA
ncbi:16S rRNA (cytosine(1402)-N(4))-methyltransferase RsmH [Planctomicrobium piriforme]|uniref:Ribosomal RNA small subunit methyltransferase H n=1 Tax=Planctomicrobium piriforme TaxID=1576369 RepID=A0A1I3HEV8_9PLAN|nr:16S rRNA (cytosine(1402)-N(4))-methyltransferase RsmH [Planctomicrobium piriforme]SFI34203.1 16S rRNA (cytosine1402-N4)-methyltransferase [Planctomicrobium piriforme]